MVTRLFAWIRGLRERRVIEAELEEELAFHLEQEAARHAARGVPAAEARRLAALSLGGVAQTREAVHDVRRPWVEAAWREACQGVRTLWATPAYAAPAIAVLALGIGGTTAVFSVLDSVLLRPLPYPDAGALVRVWSRNDERRIPFLSVSPADFEDWGMRASALDRVGAYERPRVVPLGDAGEPIAVMSVTPDLFPTVGIAPAIGRGFRDDAGDDAAVVLSHALWQRYFGGAADAIGRSLPLDGGTWTVVGIMPPRFEVPTAPADAWVRLNLRAAPAPFAHTLRVVARARAGSDAAGRVTRDLEQVAAQLAVERPGENRGWSVTVLPLFDVVVSPEFRRSLWIVAGAVLFVLLMAGASAASLLLTRASGRQRELAVRVALGASRGSLVRLLVLESLILGVVAGLAGLGLASAGVAGLQQLGSVTVPRLDEVALSGRSFVVAAAATLAAALAAGLFPAWRSTRSLHDRLRVRGDVSEPASARTLHGLVIVEVMAAVLLVLGAALLIQTVLKLQQRAIGFDARKLVVVEAIWPSPGQSAGLVPQVEEALARVVTMPGVGSAAAISGPPFSGGNSGNTFEIEGQVTDGGAPPDADYRVVTPDYFDTLGISLRAGRGFTGADGDALGAVIISETAARRFWPEGDAVGRRLRIGRSDWLTIIGIAADVRYLALDDPSEAVRPMLYLPHRQMPSTPMTLVLRSGVAPAAMAATLRRTLPAGAGATVTRVETMQGLLREASASQRFTMNLVSAFALTSVAMAVVGLYGLLAYLIARRTREIGVRVALGARHWQVVRAVAGRTLGVVCVGIGAGLVGAAAVSNALRSALFGVSPHDPLTYALVAVGFAAVALAASTVPTLRALRIDPVRVIRAEL